MLRKFTNGLSECETKCGRFWIYGKGTEWVLCIRKYEPESVKPKSKPKPGEPPIKPWNWLKLGSFESAEAAQKRALDNTESGVTLEWY